MPENQQTKTINIPLDLHRRIKKYAAKTDCKMRKLISEWLEAGLSFDEARRKNAAN